MDRLDKLLNKILTDIYASPYLREYEPAAFAYDFPVSTEFYNPLRSFWPGIAVDHVHNPVPIMEALCTAPSASSSNATTRMPVVNVRNGLR